VAVGDRFIYEEMEKGGYAIGAEQSGHLIVKKYSSTGDGILTGIRLCEEMLDSDRSLSELASPFAPLPQITVSVRVKDKSVADAPEVKAEKRRIEEALGDCGRVILRKSGTEPVVRIMAECESESEAQRITSTLSSLIEKLDREGAE
jgi:phosphoglucosamine mutase